MKLLLLATFAPLLLFPSTSAFGAACPTPPATGSISWTTPWCDEFNGTAIDTNIWAFDTGNSGFGNNELENYCDPSSNTPPCSSSTPNAFISSCPTSSGSCLAIKVLGPAANTWASARLMMRGPGSPTINAGRIEASIQIPSHPGLWPAFWMLGSQTGVSWPTVGESDIMENWPMSVLNGPGATGNRSTIHTQVTAGNGKGGSFNFPSGQQVDTAFHIYGQIWSANMIQYYVDDPTQPFFVVTASDLAAGDTWPFSSPNNPFFLIMNMAVGGTLGGTPDTQTGSQAPMLVDYVRQYLPVPSTVPAPSLTPNGNITIKAGTTTGNTTTIDILGTIGTGRVTFSCTTNAPKASCVVTSNDPVNNHTVDFSSSGTASPTVTVTTTANTAASGISSLTWMGLVSGGVLVLSLWSLKRHTREIRLGIGLASVVLAIVILPACGGGSSSSGGGGGGGFNGTTPGSYTVTVNAFTESSSDASVPDAKTTFNLTVN